MPQISFFQQERRDGGVRTGIDIDGATVLHHFAPGPHDSDPALNWYVDVRGEGARLPATPDGARRWFLENAETIRAALGELANDLRAGIDVDVWPLRRAVARAPRRVRITIVCSATRRMQALSIAQILDHVRDHWEEEIQKLREVQPAAQ
jgi:hypothetical protein